MDGFLNLHKSAGYTSHDCVAKVRRSLQQKRVGHAGTLDPAATGVLPMALGRATRLLQFLPQNKTYRATIRLGIHTTTDDLEGEVIASHPAPELELDAVKTALKQFQGVIQQVPPNYSAIQVQGQRLYELARSGKPIAVQPRQVEVYAIRVLSWQAADFPELEVEIACGPGTYIRAIARDLGQVLGLGGTLATLLRTESSGFGLEHSLTLEQLAQQVDAGEFQPLASEAGLSHLTAIALAENPAQRWCQGQRIAWKDLAIAEPILNVPLRIHHESDRFLGVGIPVMGETDVILSPQVVFPD